MTNPQKTPSKAQRVRQHILSGRTITGKQALERYGLYRLSSVIFRLRKEGHPIQTISISENGDTYAKYKLAVPPMSYAP